MKDQNGPAALDRIADAVELYVLENLGHGDDLANAVAHLRTRIATRYRTAATSPVTPATGGTSGHSEVPPDRDPTWRDVPAECCDDDTLVRIGDRVWGSSGVWLVERRGRIRRSTDVWIKRYDHPARVRAPQTVDACPCCGFSGQWREDERPDVCVRCGRGAGHPFAQPRPAEPDVTPPEGDVEAAIEARGGRDIEPIESVAEDDRCECYRAGGGEHLRCTRVHGHAGPCARADVEPRSPGPRDQCARMLGPGQWCNRLPGHDGECKAPAPESEARHGPRPWVATPCHVELWDAIIDFADAPPVSVKRGLAVVAVERAVAAIVSAAIEKAVQKP